MAKVKKQPPQPSQLSISFHLVGSTDKVVFANETDWVMKRVLSPISDFIRTHYNGSCTVYMNGRKPHPSARKLILKRGTDFFGDEWYTCGTLTLCGRDSLDVFGFNALYPPRQLTLWVTKY